MQPSPRAMWRFYGPLLRSELWPLLIRGTDGSGRLILWIGLVLTILIALNQQIGDRLQARWLHISPWFALIPLSLELVYTLLALGYWRAEDLRASGTELQAEVSALMGVSSNRYPMLRARAAELFANFKLDAPERELLASRANDILSGQDLDYDIQLAGESGRPLRVDAGHYELRWKDVQGKVWSGVISCPDRETLVRIRDTHRAMVSEIKAEVYRTASQAATSRP